MCSVISSYCTGARRREGGLESRMGLLIVFETRGFFLSVTTSSQRKWPWMKQVDSTFLQIRPPSQDPHNRTCIRKQSKRSVDWSGSLEMMCSGVPGEYSSAAKVWCSLGSVQWREEKNKTNKNSFSKADKLRNQTSQGRLHGWPTLSTAVTHPCTFKRNYSHPGIQFLSGWLSAEWDSVL